MRTLFTAILAAACLAAVFLPAPVAAAIIPQNNPGSSKIDAIADALELQATSQSSIAQSATPQPIFAVQTATPQPDGSIIHEVLYGQTLYAIAEAYQISIGALAALNNLAQPYTIFPGDKLLIQAAPTPTATSEATATSAATRAPTATRRPPTATPTVTATPKATATPTPAPFIQIPRVTIDSKDVGAFLIAICTLGLVVVGITSFRKK